MQIILLESFDKLGKIGDVVDVKDGYARNFLLPQKKALRANKENKDYFEKIKKSLEEKNKELVNNAQKLSEKLIDREIIFIRQASETGQLYGSVSPKDISNYFKKEKIDIPPSNINLTSAIKKTGIFDVKIKLHADVSMGVTLNVAISEEFAKIQKKEMSQNQKSEKEPQANNNDNKEEILSQKAEVNDKPKEKEKKLKTKNKIKSNNDKIKKNEDLKNPKIEKVKSTQNAKSKASDENNGSKSKLKKEEQ